MATELPNMDLACVHRTAAAARCIFAALAAGALAAASVGSSYAASNCNKQDGYLSEIGTDDESSADRVPALPADPGGQPRSDLDPQTLKIRLGLDLDNLIGLSGRYTQGAPVLGLRVENDPNFDDKKCNRLYIQLVKPRIDRLPNGAWEASYDDKKRFVISSTELGPRDAWKIDRDPQGKFFWIVPARFASSALKMTTSYNDAFLAEKNPLQRRVIATAYLNLAMRLHRLHSLNQNYPQPPVPTREELQKVIKGELQLDCAKTPQALQCLVSDVIEANETATKSPRFLSGDGFRAGDSLYENSGITFGIRQMDAGAKDEQTEVVGKQILPAIFSATPYGQGLRRPIRLWDVDSLNQWYGALGRDANDRLSTPAAKELLLRAHAQFVKDQSSRVKANVDKAYPMWTNTNRLLLTTIAVDLQNNTGYVMRYPKGAQTVCAVLTDTTLQLGNKMTNRGLVKERPTRVQKAYEIFAKRFVSSTYEAGPCRFGATQAPST